MDYVSEKRVITVHNSRVTLKLRKDAHVLLQRICISNYFNSFADLLTWGVSYAMKRIFLCVSDV